MPSVGLIGTNGPDPSTPKTGLLTLDFLLNEGPYPGTVNFAFVATFLGPPFLVPPNVLVSSGNVHWTGHAIWVSTTGAGIVVNNKSPSPGGRNFTVYVLAMGMLSPATPGKESAALQATVRPVSLEELQTLAPS